MAFAIIFHHKEDETKDVSVPATDADQCATDQCTSCHVGDDVETGVAVDRRESVDRTARMSCRSLEDVEETSSSDEKLDEKPSAIIRKVEDPDLAPQEEAPAVSAQEAVPLVTKTEVNRQLCASILLGDAFHNFADGVFIAAAFKSCSAATALSIILVTLFHEIAQELADFVILTRYAGLSVVKACVLNFLSGLSVCLGGIVFLAADPSDQATGIILGMAGGVYFNIACCETIPRIETVIQGRWDRVWTLLSVIIGTIPIGLILLNHQHCG